jgi:hypothetical protein
MKYSYDRYYRDSIVTEVNKTIENLDKQTKESFLEKIRKYIIKLLCKF